MVVFEYIENIVEEPSLQGLFSIRKSLKVRRKLWNLDSQQKSLSEP